MRNIAVICAVLFTIVAALPPPAAAQLLNKDAPVIVGHYHLNVSSIDAHKKFWVDTLGGTATKIGDVDAIRFPNVYLMLRLQAPTGARAARRSITSASPCPTCRR